MDYNMSLSPVVSYEARAATPAEVLHRQADERRQLAIIAEQHQNAMAAAMPPAHMMHGYHPATGAPFPPPATGAPYTPFPPPGTAAPYPAFPYAGTAAPYPPFPPATAAPYPYPFPPATAAPYGMYPPPHPAQFSYTPPY